MRGSKREIRRGVWELRVSIGPDPRTGRYRKVSRIFRGLARAADDALRDLIDEQALISDDGRKVTVGRLLDRWIEECERLDLSPTTLRSYRSQIERRVRPELGRLQVTLNASTCSLATRVSSCTLTCNHPTSGSERPLPRRTQSRTTRCPPQTSRRVRAGSGGPRAFGRGMSSVKLGELPTCAERTPLREVQSRQRLEMPQDPHINTVTG